MNRKLHDRAFQTLLHGGLVLFLVVFGGRLISTGMAERRLAHAPRVPISQLARHPDGTVLVRAVLTASPPLRAPNGESLAFQAVTVSRQESSGSGADRTERTVVDYQRIAPEVLLAVEGESVAGIVPTGIDLRFVPERFAGPLERGGVLPEAAAALLGSAFAGLPVRSGAELSVHAIPDGAEVTVHGRVAMSRGQALLVAPVDGPLVVSPMSMEEVAKRAGTSGTIGLVLGWLLLTGGIALGAAVIRGALRRGSAPAPA